LKEVKYGKEVCRYKELKRNEGMEFKGRII
jgi:hypothetical protein